MRFIYYVPEVGQKFVTECADVKNIQRAQAEDLAARVKGTVVYEEVERAHTGSFASNYK